MKRLLLVAVLLLPVPFAALPLVSVAIAFGDHQSSPTLLAEVVPAQLPAPEHAQLAFSPGAQPERRCDVPAAGF